MTKCLATVRKKPSARASRAGRWVLAHKVCGSQTLGSFLALASVSHVEGGGWGRAAGIRSELRRLALARVDLSN